MTSASARETGRLGERLGTLLSGGEFLALTGDLGAGKTHFTKGLAVGLEIDPRAVTSPTFLLIHELEGRLPLLHMDAYRISGGEELAELGGTDLLDGRSVAVLEWAERAADLLPAEYLEVRILVTGEEARILEFIPHGRACAGLLDRLRAILREDAS